MKRISSSVTGILSTPNTLIYYIKIIRYFVASSEKFNKTISNGVLFELLKEFVKTIVRKVSAYVLGNKF